MIIAFDFDGVLTDIRMQIFAKKMRVERHEVWIITARRNNEYNKKIVEPILEKIGLFEGMVIYTDEKPKREYLKGLNADIYIDNIPDEINTINNYTNTIALLWQS